MRPRLLVACVVLAASHAACSGPDPGFVEFSERQPSSSGGSGSGSSSTSGGADGGGSSSGGVDGGGGGGDGGGSSGTFSPINLWQGVPAFGAAGAAVGPGTIADGAANHGANGNPAGKDCLPCHAGATAPAFAFAGTVYLDAAGNTPAGGAEVRITTNEGVQLALVKANPDGNFWVPKGNITIPAMSISAARTAQAQKTMASRLSGNADGSCNKTGCHMADRINP